MTEFEHPWAAPTTEGPVHLPSARSQEEELIRKVKKILEDASLSDQVIVARAMVLIWQWEARNGYPFGTDSEAAG